jgi:3-hydroxyisobutyrate dehydrogenase
MAGTPLKVTLLGTGTMGVGMTHSMLRAGLPVTVWNRHAERAQPLGDDGATVAASVEDAVRDADVVITMLFDEPAVTEVMTAAAGAMRADAVWVQASTVGRRGIAALAAFAEERGLTMLDAPVVGTKQPAEDGKLVVLASGREELADRVRPIFDAVGQKTIWVGKAGAGTRLKIVCNSWVLTVTEACAEMIALAQALDVDPSLVFDAIEGGTLDLPYLRIKGKAILERNFEPMFRLKLAAKDAGLVEESADRHEVEVPLFGVIREQMSAAAEDHGEEDMSATYFASAPASAR